MRYHMDKSNIQCCFQWGILSKMIFQMGEVLVVHADFAEFVLKLTKP